MSARLLVAHEDLWVAVTDQCYSIVNNSACMTSCVQSPLIYKCYLTFLHLNSQGFPQPFIVYCTATVVGRRLLGTSL